MGKVFRQYKSTIYGNYRKAYLMDGVLTGVAMSVLMLLRDWLADTPMESPENYVTDLILLVAIIWSAYQYRKDLEGGKVTLKELMLLGLGIGVVSAVVYGLWTWLYCGVLNTGMVDYYNQQRIATMPTEGAQEMADIEMVRHYGAGDWAFIGGFRNMVMSILFAFIAAMVLRTEKAPVKVKKHDAQE